MRRTTIGDLVVPFVIIGLTVYVLLRFSYDSIPPLGYGVPLPLAVLAIAELVMAHRVRLAVRHDPRAKLMTAIAIARCVALGKASSLVGAGLIGASIGVLARVAPRAGTVRAAASDTRVAIALLGCTILLTVAGLVLERAGLDPNRHAHTGTDG
jgi:Na+/H+ antiporter NhaB